MHVRKTRLAGHAAVAVSTRVSDRLSRPRAVVLDLASVRSHAQNRGVRPGIPPTSSRGAVKNPHLRRMPG